MLGFRLSHRSIEMPSDKGFSEIFPVEIVELLYHFANELCIPWNFDDCKPSVCIDTEMALLLACAEHLALYLIVVSV